MLSFSSNTHTYKHTSAKPTSCRAFLVISPNGLNAKSVYVCARVCVLYVFVLCVWKPGTLLLPFVNLL